MRYISQHANHVISRRNGKPLYKFGPSGVLVVGSATTNGTGNEITHTYDSTTVGNNPFSLYESGLSGTSGQPAIEIYGQGSLDGQDADGNALNDLFDGYRGYFFPAPIIDVSGTSSDNISGLSGIWYEVLLGKVSYSGVVYKKGDLIKADGGTTDATAYPTTSTAKIALAIPPALKSYKKYDRDGEFHNKNLGYGDEPYSYYNFTSGYEPRNSVTNTDDDYLGYFR